MDRLLTKQKTPPFLPQVNDPELMRQQLKKIVRIKDLRESTPYSEGMATLLEGLNREVFDTFGTNIDESGKDRLAQNKHQSDKMR